MLKLISEEHKYEIKKSAIINDRFILEIEKGTYKELNVEDMIAAIDEEDGLIMGIFKVIEIRNKSYYAVSSGYIDPVWLGYIRENGETSMNPYIWAVYLPQGVYDDRQSKFS